MDLSTDSCFFTGTLPGPIEGLKRSVPPSTLISYTHIILAVYVLVPPRFVYRAYRSAFPVRIALFQPPSRASTPDPGARLQPRRVDIGARDQGGGSTPPEGGGGGGGGRGAARAAAAASAAEGRRRATEEREEGRESGGEGGRAGAARGVGRREGEGVGEERSGVGRREGGSGRAASVSAVVPPRATSWYCP